ncbi:FAD binding domain-containing protein [Endomicrobium sp. AH-315-J14]|nr:FAD binding domain-containing protein [Endomicrobium sp. AH-315-J14]
MTIQDLTRYQMRHVDDLTTLCELLASEEGSNPPAVMLAGGTDFVIEVNLREPSDEPVPLVVDISRMDELRGVDWDGKRLRIGAATTYLEIQRDSHVLEHAPLIERMTHDVGGPTIQARGTLGGNLATGSPAADGVAAIAPYDPEVVLQSVRGTRRVPMAALQTGYKQSTRAADEVIVAVEIVPLAPGSPWCWRKVGTRLAQAISKVALGGVAEVEDGTITRIGLAMASVGPVTELLPKTRALLLNQPVASIDGAALDAAVDSDVTPIDDIRSTGAYRAHCARAVVRGFVRDLGAAV